ncbi:PD-(D/E)XK nuclease family protein [Mumia xiangluensis]|uniref:PD-(D/E)XK nuclease family protein n=1 Tax=Mumia xiangluensis TaxID=1678900 RepID=A0ABW1QU49_9ACTN
MGITVSTASYGHDALQRLADVVGRWKSDDPMREVTILAPSNLAGIVARRHLARGSAGGRGVAGIDVTTLPRLAERIAAHTLAPRRPATRPVVASAWRTQLREDPGVFAEVATHPATITALGRAYAELREVSDGGLTTIGGASALASDLVRLHRGVQTALGSDWLLATDLVDAASEAVRADGFPSPVVVYLPQVLTPSERRLVQALGSATDVDVVLGLTHAVRADAAPRDTIARIGVDAPPTARAEVAVADRVINASDSDDEVRCVVRDVLVTLQTVPASRVAILYAAASPYARLLHEHLTQAGVAFNGPGVRGVTERAVARVLLEVLRLDDTDMARPDLFRAVANAPTRAFTGERIPVTRWERLSRAAGVMRGDDWVERLALYAADEQSRAAELERDEDETWRVDRHRQNAATAGDLRTFAVTLRAELARAGTMTSWRDLAAWCLELFTTLVGAPDELRTLPPDEQYAAAAVVSTLRGLASLEDVEGSASLTMLRDVLEVELDASLPRVGRFGEGILVAPLSATVGLDLEITYAVGLSEDLYPGGTREDALLPARVRALVPDELQDAHERLHTKYRHLLAAFASARTVVATFPRGDLRRSTRRLPSRWLLGTLRALVDDRGLAATEWEDAEFPDAFATSGSFAGELLTAAMPATEQEWQVRAAVTGALDDPTVDAAHAMVEARAGHAFTRYDGNLAAVDGLPDFAREERLVSPTTLESYAACPHAYFVQRLLGVRPVEQPEDTVTMSPADVGTLVHACIEQLVTDFRDDLPGPGEPWTPAQRARLVDIADEKTREAEARGLTGHPRLWEPERLRVLADLVAMLDADDLWRAAIGARVLASELAFGMDGRSPVEVRVPGGRVLMRGSADKVDATDSRLFVTDIKTGSRRLFKEINQDDPLVAGTKLQLPVYAYAARAAYGDRETPVTAGYWFVRREPGRIDLQLTPEVESAYAETLDVLVRSIAGGLFPGKAPEAPDFAWVQCPYCNPDGIGHVEQRERWERQRADPALRELVTLIDPGALDETAADGGAA